MLFKHCSGYGLGEEPASNAAHRMLVICGGQRVQTVDNVKSSPYIIYAVDGSHVGTVSLHTSRHRDNFTLGPLTTDAKDDEKQPRSVEQLKTVLESAYLNLPITTQFDAWKDVDQEKQRVEMILTMSMKEVVDNELKTPQGNSSAVDCNFKNGYVTDRSTGKTDSSGLQSHHC